MQPTNSGWLWRVLGGIVGGAGGTALGLLTWYAFDQSTLAGVIVLIGGLLVATLPLYLVAGRTASIDGVNAEFMPGLLIGVNAGLNAVFLAALIHPLTALLVVIVVPALIPAVARSDVYQAFLGWANFLYPMSWLVSGLGLVFMLVSALLFGVTIGRVNFLKITKVLVDWKTGTFFIVGGLAGNGNLREGSTGFNMGNFAFLRASAGADPQLIEHEAGHGLNLAAFGFVFHFIGAIDENVTGGNDKAYSERFAESNVPSTFTRGPTLPIWGV
jgi:hypothetical protein